MTSKPAAGDGCCDQLGFHLRQIRACHAVLAPSARRAPVTPRRIALTDPASRWTAATRQAAFYAYSTNYMIDLDHAVIVDVKATTSVRQAEVTAQRKPSERRTASNHMRRTVANRELCVRDRRPIAIHSTHALGG